MEGDILDATHVDFGFLGDVFKRKDSLVSARSYIECLLSDVVRKTSWQMSEKCGFSRPYRFQHLLGRSRWDDEELRKEASNIATEALGSKGCVLAVDETGFIKKGRYSAGVSRQYTGTAGRIENCQVGIFLNYITDAGHCLIDRELYLPKSWVDDNSRLEAVIGKRKGPSFKTKQSLAKSMLERAFSSGISPDWVTADSLYGSDTKFRNFLEVRRQPFIVAVRSTAHVSANLNYQSISHGFSEIKGKDWHRISQGHGTKGLRLYDWAAFRCMHPYNEQWSRIAICRRSVSKPNEVQYFIAFCERHVPIEEIIQAAGKRWAIEEDFEVTKGELGLDHYEVRSIDGWYRHMSLCLTAQALLVSRRVKLEALRKSEFPLKKTIDTSTCFSAGH